MEPLFDHEKLDVYCVELGFVAWIAAFLDDASKSAGQHRRELINNSTARASPSFSIRPKGTVNGRVANAPGFSTTPVARP
jgi:hypothetical protein